MVIYVIFFLTVYAVGDLTQPGYLRDMLPDSAPDHPEPLKELLHGT